MALYKCTNHLSFQAIHGYRETERSRWTQKNKLNLQKVGDLAFPLGKPQMTYVHVLDLAKEGHIKAHIDSVRVGLGIFSIRKLPVRPLSVSFTFIWSCGV